MGTVKAAGEGQVVAAYGRQYEVELQDGGRILCFTRGKKSHLACGDRVSVEIAADGQGVVSSVARRSTLLYRSDAYRQKLIAANATQVIVVVAAAPSFSEDFISCCLVAAQQEQMSALLVLNKIDLVAAAPAARTRLVPFTRLGYPLLELSAQESAAPLRPHLDGHLSVLIGQSGMGKSTLINTLVPHARAVTREISTALDSGKHTTTHARLYRLDAHSAIIDSPGMQEFGLAHLTRQDLESGFIEFRPYLGHCRFRDCAHETEPDCAIRAAADRGDIDARRLALFRSLSDAVESGRRYE